MAMLSGYASVFIFLVAIGVFQEHHHRQSPSGNFSDYATGGRSFGSFYSTMAFLNTWLPGTMFISFAGYAVSDGIIAFHYVPYSLLAAVLMFMLAKPVYVWGVAFDLRSQAELLGLRYNATVRVMAAIVGLVSGFPWLVLGIQSLSLVFSRLSFGTVGVGSAVIIGVGVITARQIWAMRYGARGVIISDLIQGMVAYFVGTALALGLLCFLTIDQGTSAALNGNFFSGLQGSNTEAAPLYLFSLIVTGAFGGWCWPDIFVRLFSSRSPRTIQIAAIQAAPIVLIFGTVMTLLALAAVSLPGVAETPDQVWFIAAGQGGYAIVILAAICVVAATVGSMNAGLQALGLQAANDIIAVFQRRRIENVRIGQACVGLLTVFAAVVATATAHSTEMITFAIISYQGIVQLAPTLFLGIFWKRGTATAAIAAMAIGFSTAVALQCCYPLAIPALNGLSSGAVALLLNLLVYVAISLFFPMSGAECERVAKLHRTVSDYSSAH